MGMQEAYGSSGCFHHSFCVVCNSPLSVPKQNVEPPYELVKWFPSVSTAAYLGVCSLVLGVI